MSYTIKWRISCLRCKGHQLKSCQGHQIGQRRLSVASIIEVCHETVKGRELMERDCRCGGGRGGKVWFSLLLRRYTVLSEWAKGSHKFILEHSARLPFVHCLKLLVFCQCSNAASDLMLTTLRCMQLSSSKPWLIQPLWKMKKKKKKLCSRGLSMYSRPWKL